MKYLILLAVVLTGCTDAKEGFDRAQQTSDDYRSRIYELESQLSTCQAKLPMEASTFNPEPEEPSKPGEPQYEEVDVWLVDGTKCYGATDSESIPACGRSFWDCKDGFARNCMTNVKYKTSTEQKLVEE